MGNLNKRFVDLPGPAPIRIDANIVACLRLEAAERGQYLIIHTYENFSFAVSPAENQSAKKFYKEVYAAIWPAKSSRTTK